MDIYLITQNQGKLAAAQAVFESTQINLLMPPNDYPEIQASNSLEIAKYTSIQAALELGKPALREDHSLILNGLKGFPGPYTNHFDKLITEHDLLNLYKHIEDRSGYFEVATVLVYPDSKVISTVFQVPFSLATESRGNLQNGWNKIIILKGETRTLAQYPETERIHIWQQGFRKIAKELTK